MEHVRIGQDRVRPLTDLPPLLGGRVAVVDRGLQPRQAVAVQRARLVLGERLRGVEVERAALGLPRQLVEDGEVEGERLSGSRARRDDHVLAAAGGLPCLGLVRVEDGDPDRSAGLRVEFLRERRGAPCPRRLLGQIRELRAGKQVLPGGDVEGHRSIEAGQTDAQRSQVASGTSPARIPSAKTLQPTQKPAKASSEANTSTTPARIQATVSWPVKAKPTAAS